MKEPCLAIAERFASMLDADDFEALHELLSDACEYVIRDRTLRGPEAIARSYREASDWARSHIESVAYESSIRLQSARLAVVTFIDHLDHHGQRHTHRCEQEVLVNEAGKIIRIMHRDLPGEREAVDAFLTRIGVSRQGEPA